MKQSGRPQRNPSDYGYPSPDIVALSAKALEVTKRLTDYYGIAPWSTKDPMSQLVDIILSHRTRDEQTAAAYDNLLQRFSSWEAVRDAPMNEVQDAISNVNWPEVKAPRLQTIMRQITQERGELNFDFTSPERRRGGARGAPSPALGAGSGTLRRTWAREPRAKKP